MLVGAERSPPMYARILDALERCLPAVRRVTIPGTSHPMNHGNPEAFDRAVLDFQKRGLGTLSGGLTLSWLL